MASSEEYVNFVCSQIEGVGVIRAKRMFGEWGIYVDEKMVMMVCDDISYVRQVTEIADLMRDAERGFPYPGSKEYYILDVDHRDHARQVVKVLAEVLPYPKSRAKKGTASQAKK